MALHGAVRLGRMVRAGGEPRAVDIWLKRQSPAARTVGPETTAWVLVVSYRANGNEYATRLALRSDAVALRVDRLLAATRLGSRVAARALFACLHEEWGHTGLVRRDSAWEAVFRYLAPLVTSTTVDAVDL